MKTIIKKIIAIYLRILTKIVFLRFHPEVIVIAGTHNKTPTKNCLADILSRFFSVQYPPYSYNTEIGVPLTILGVTAGKSLSWFKVLFRATIAALCTRKYPDKLILELGSDQPGDIEYLLSILPTPTIAILTNIAPEYVSNFGSLDNIAKEFAALTDKLPPTSYLIYNQDDQRLVELAQQSSAQLISYAIEAKQADWQVEVVEKTNHGQNVIINHRDTKIKIHTKHFGRNSIYTILISLAVMDIYNLPTKQIDNDCLKFL